MHLSVESIVRPVGESVLGAAALARGPERRTSPAANAFEADALALPGRLSGDGREVLDSVALDEETPLGLGPGWLCGAGRGALGSTAFDEDAALGLGPNEIGGPVVSTGLSTASEPAELVGMVTGPWLLYDEPAPLASCGPWSAAAT